MGCDKCTHYGEDASVYYSSETNVRILIKFNTGGCLPPPPQKMSAEFKLGDYASYLIPTLQEL